MQPWPGRKHMCGGQLAPSSAISTLGGISRTPVAFSPSPHRRAALHYFPTTPPQPAADPELERSRFLSDSRARARDRLARGNDAVGLANAVVELATVKGEADPEALTEMVDAIHTGGHAAPGHSQEFEEQILSLVTTQLAWSRSGITTIDDLTALSCERGKA